MADVVLGIGDIVLALKDHVGQWGRKILIYMCFERQTQATWRVGDPELLWNFSS